MMGTFNFPRVFLINHLYEVSKFPRVPDDFDVASRGESFRYLAILQRGFLLMRYLST